MNKQSEWDSFNDKEKTALMSLFKEEALKNKYCQGPSKIKRLLQNGFVEIVEK